MPIDFFIKVTFSLFLGLLIGIDRQLKHKPLGLKTCMVISVASCLVTVISIESIEKFHNLALTNRDPMRLAAQIVSGVGFLGAGVILRRNNDVISGLTSAAMIWAASGIGIAVGAGFYWEASYSVFIIILAVNVLPFLIRLIGPKKLSHKDISVKLIVDPSCDVTQIIMNIESDQELARKKGLDIRHIKLKDLESGNRQISLILSATHKHYVTEVYKVVKQTENVLTVEIEEL
ncbi:MgtC/SapB family protein [Paenibacillus nasutitermitis]|uniref:MgtC/SapB family protein n=1 Tax=Paenibacillus nasutitermitis TaxID=1652958 RepID=UPI00166291A0|nr:MgtC/SapB family protein [Paenibacillus nasutitermitis]